MNQRSSLGMLLVLTGLAMVLSYPLSHSMLLIGSGLYPIFLGLSCVSLAGAGSGSPPGKKAKAGSMSADARFIASLGVSLGLADILLTLFNQQDLSVYFVVYSLVFMLMTLLNAHLPRGTRARLDILGSLLFVTFLVVLSLKIAQIMR